MKTVREFNLKGKRVLVRCDFNIPLSEGEILDDFRIRKTIPTIKYLIKKGAKIILISHLGRPEGREEKYSLKPVALRLKRLLRKPVHPVKSDKVGAKQFKRVKFLPDCIGSKVEKEIEKMKEKDIVLLENLRFHKGEEENDENFAKKLSKLGDIFINDAFGASHRAHASIVGIPKFLISGAGLLLEMEIKILKNLLQNPKKPLIAIVGGKKVEDKVKAIDKISKVAHFILINGLIRREIKEKNIYLKFPKKLIEPIDEIDGKDIGPLTISLFKQKIALAKTIFWNGPLGQIEKEEFQKGTKEIAKAIIESGAFSVIGGGETVEFINQCKWASKFNHVSTGGGAMLEFIAGERLPGLDALNYYA
jgi:phosphoglycerate kinase